ncbi:MAG TPA: hypothetical protein VFH29_07245, partial [Anaerolineales bacterium]|nr:hypothetical protein [Anaerolineales bacterium]
GEPTLRPDLMDLIRHAEALGQVCGLLTDGLKLADRAYLNDLLMSGLDHVLMLLHPRNPESWKALETILAEDIFVTVHLTISSESQAASLADLERLAGLGVRAVSLSFADSGIPGTELVNRAAGLGLALKYDLPVPYSADHPVARETADDVQFDGAGKAWLYIEPDGDVLPAQGLASKVLGNILRDPWERIYHA